MAPTHSPLDRGIRPSSSRHQQFIPLGLAVRCCIAIQAVGTFFGPPWLYISFWGQA